MTKQFQVEIVNVGQPSYTKTAKGGYNSFELAFKQDGKIAGKKFFDFGGKAVYNQLLGAKPGENFLVTSEKDDKGYFQWQTLEAVSAQPVTAEGTATEVAQPSSGQRSSGRVVGSTYETAEERATKQAVIVRQAVLNAAIAASLKIDVDQVTSEDDIIALARRFEDFVYADIEGRIASIRAAVKQA